MTEMNPNSPQPSTPPSAGQTLSGRPWISYEEFSKMDVRVAKVVEVSEHPNADKLLVLKIDLGDHQRQIIAGLKKHYSPEALLGKSIVVLANLQPRKMRGLESEGMLLAASDGAGDEQKIVILTLDEDVPAGSPIS